MNAFYSLAFFAITSLAAFAASSESLEGKYIAESGSSDEITFTSSGNFVMSNGMAGQYRLDGELIFLSGIPVIGQIAGTVKNDSITLTEPAVLNGTLRKRTYARDTPQRFVKTALLAASACRFTISERFGAPVSGATPKANGWDCQDGKLAIKDVIVATSETGTIYLILRRGKQGEELFDKVIPFAPMANGAPARWSGKPIQISNWRCGNSADLPKGAQPVNSRLLLEVGCKPQ